MRIRPPAAALLLLFACAPAAEAQNAVLRPGSGEVSAESAAEGVEEFDVYAGAGAGEQPPAGRMTLRTRVAEIGGTPALVRTEAVWMDDALVQVDSFVLHRRTLAPLAMRSASAEGGVQLEFTPGAVRQVDHGEWGADTTVVPLAEPVFLSGTADLLLGALPLAAGYAAELAVYDPEDGVGTIGIDVELAEDLALPGGGTAAVWRVRVDEGGLAATYWMDRESRRLVQFESAGGGFRVVRSRGSRSRARPTR